MKLLRIVNRCFKLYSDVQVSTDAYLSKNDFFLTFLFWRFKRSNRQKTKYGEWSGGQILWDQNSTFSGDQIIFDHEIKFFCHFSWDRNSLIMLFRVSISWSFLCLTNRSWDQN